MRPESRPEPLSRVALALAFFLTALFIVQAYSAFGRGGAGWLRPSAAVLLAAAGCATSHRLSRMAPGGRTSHRRALIGTAMMVGVLYALIGLAQFTSLGEQLRPWEFLILPICTFTFFLSSQLSFLLLALIEGVVLLWSLKEPADLIQVVAAVLAYFMGFCVLLAVLHYRERVRAAPSTHPPEPDLPLRVGPVIGLLLVDLFGMFYVVKPPAPPPPADGSERAPAAESDPEPPSFLGLGDGGSSLRFRRDLKFGDQLPGEAASPVLMMVQVRWGTDRSIHPEEAEFPLLWKMSALGEYGGFHWKPLDGDERRIAAADGEIELPTPRPHARTFWVEQRFLLAPMSHRGLFMLYAPKLININEISIDPEGSLMRPELSEEPLKYSVMSYVPQRLRERLENAQALHPDPRYRAIPYFVERDPVFQSVLKPLKSATTAIDAIEGVVALLSRFQYTRTPRLTPTKDPTLEFLRSRRGYCQHFASAAALLLRQLNIPARVAIGFSGGEWSDTANAILIRREHAHAWIEVHFENIGWLPFDPVMAVGNVEAAAPRNPSENPGQRPAQPDSNPAVRRDPPRPAEELRDPSTPVQPPSLPDLGRTADSFDDLWSRFVARPRPRKVEASPAPSRPAAPAPASSSEFFARTASADAALVAGIALVAILVLLSGRRRASARASRRATAAAPIGSAGSPDPDEDRSRRFLLFPRGSRRRQLVDLYVEFLRRAARLGFGRSESQTASEHADLLAQRVRPAPRDLGQVTALFERARYGESAVSDEELTLAKSAIKEAYAALKRGRSPGD